MTELIDEPALEISKLEAGKKLIYIYKLFDPTGVSKTIYIGWTFDPKHRKSNHLAAARVNNSNYRTSWIRSLLARNVTFGMEIIEYVYNGDWNEAETRQIKRYKDAGYHLCNSTEGGEGCVGYKHTMGNKAIMSSLKKGCPLHPNAKKALTIRMTTLHPFKGRKLTLDQIQILRRANLGRIQSKESLEKRSMAMKGKLPWNTGKHLSEEHKQKISLAERGKKVSEETKKKISAGHLGKVLSDAHKQKLSEAHRGLNYNMDIDNEKLEEMFRNGKSMREIAKYFDADHSVIKHRLQVHFPELYKQMRDIREQDLAFRMAKNAIKRANTKKRGPYKKKDIDKEPLEEDLDKQDPMPILDFCI